MFYAYRHMRAVLGNQYPSDPQLNAPSSITDTISWDKLQKIRVDNDHEASTGYSYETIGNDGFVDRWIDHAIADGLLLDFWRQDLQHYSTLERGPANQILMEKLRFDDA